LRVPSVARSNVVSAANSSRVSGDYRCDAADLCKTSSSNQRKVARGCSGCCKTCRWPTTLPKGTQTGAGIRLDSHRRTRLCPCCTAQLPRLPSGSRESRPSSPCSCPCAFALPWTRACPFDPFDPCDHAHRDAYPERNHVRMGRMYRKPHHGAWPNNHHRHQPPNGSTHHIHSCLDNRG
jgi:hypothetical protein